MANFMDAFAADFTEVANVTDVNSLPSVKAESYDAKDARPLANHLPLDKLVAKKEEIKLRFPTRGPYWWTADKRDARKKFLMRIKKQKKELFERYLLWKMKEQDNVAMMVADAALDELDTKIVNVHRLLGSKKTKAEILNEPLPRKHAKKVPEQTQETSDELPPADSPAEVREVSPAKPPRQNPVHANMNVANRPVQQRNPAHVNMNVANRPARPPRVNTNVSNSSLLRRNATRTQHVSKPTAAEEDVKHNSAEIPVVHSNGLAERMRSLAVRTPPAIVPANELQESALEADQLAMSKELEADQLAMMEADQLAMMEADQAMGDGSVDDEHPLAEKNYS